LFRHRILFAILLPVLLVGLIIAVIASSLFTPRLAAVLRSHTDAWLGLAADMGVERCRINFNYLLDLDLTADREMSQGLRDQTAAQIVQIGDRFPNVYVMVVDGHQRVVACGWPALAPATELQALPSAADGHIVPASLAGQPVRMVVRAFPFWNWQVVSFATEADYTAPLALARHIVGSITLGMVAALVLTCLLVFHFLVNRPLKKIIAATEGIANGRMDRLPTRRKDEIGRVVAAFNTMVAGIAGDRDQLQTVMRALRESEEMYRLITERSLTLVMMLQEGRISYANPKVAECTGYSPEELIGMEIWHLAHSADRDMVRARAMSRAMGNAGVDHYEFRYLTKTNAVRWVEILAVPMLYRDMRVTLTHGIDITQKKEAQQVKRLLEDKLQRAQKMEAIGILAGGVAHDLNNILSGLVSYPELILMNLAPDHPLRRSILRIQEAGQRAAAVVQDLLTLARRSVPTKEVVNLNDVVQEYMNSPEYQKLLESFPKVRVHLELADDLLNIFGSPVHLSKTVMNLMANAVEAATDGGEVVLATENRYIDRPIRGYDDVEEGDFAVLRVRDTGVGISADDLPRIFEPFYTKKVMGRSGTGLGMAVVWGTVKDHNAYIDVESELDRGSRFELYFPITRQKVAGRDHPLSLADFRGDETVLVVDDVPEQREIATEFLGRLGYRVTALASGEEAIAYLRDAKADLLVLDMIMDPGIDGLTTYKQILRFHPGQKAIIASGFSETENVKEAQRLGAGKYIKKPYTLEKLGWAVRSELDR